MSAYAKLEPFEIGQAMIVRHIWWKTKLDSFRNIQLLGYFNYSF